MPAWWRKLTAGCGGHFWEACPSCGREFGGHEVRAVAGGHIHSIPVTRAGEMTGSLICADCTAQGVGCRAQADLVGWYHRRCEFLTPPEVQR